jgi:hypothetical protein
MKKILDFDVEKSLEATIFRNLKDIKLFFILFAVNIGIFGQKLFSYALTPDDYNRFYDGGGQLASWLGRWMAGIINQNVFTGAMHIQPYLNGVIGIFSFTLAAFLTAKILKRSRPFEISGATLLISATPMVAYNLYFNTNIAVWIATLFGVIGLFLAQKLSKLTKIIGFIFVVISIGCYQTIVQVAIAIAMINLIIGLVEAKNKKDLRNEIINFSFSIVFIAFAFAFSSLINFLYIKFYNLEVTERLKVAADGVGFSIYWKRLIHMFHNNFGLMYFEKSLLALYRIMAFLSLVGSIFMVSKGAQPRILKIISTLLIFLVFLCIPLVINLPNITGNVIPLRAHYTIGWFMAGFFIIQIASLKKIFKTIAAAVTLSLIVLSICYINIFFDGATRQTTADIIRASQIVNRIRAHENYSGEPVKLKIIGTKGFFIPGWNSDQQALFKDWSKDDIFKHFTDLNFEIMSDAEYEVLENLLIKKGDEINSYPGRNSIYVDGDRVILFLNTNYINDSIAFNKIEKIKPNAESFFNLYIENGRLIYFKKSCSENDTANLFYLHVYPRDSDNLLSNQDHVVSYFPFNGTIKNGQCIFTQKLPNFEIKKINTGQFSNDYNEKEKKPYTIYWKSTIQVD